MFANIAYHWYRHFILVSITHWQYKVKTYKHPILKYQMFRFSYLQIKSCYIFYHLYATYSFYHCFMAADVAYTFCYRLVCWLRSTWRPTQALCCFWRKGRQLMTSSSSPRRRFSSDGSTTTCATRPRPAARFQTLAPTSRTLRRTPTCWNRLLQEKLGWTQHPWWYGNPTMVYYLHASRSLKCMQL